MVKSKKGALGKQSVPGPSKTKGDGAGNSEASNSNGPPCTEEEKKIAKRTIPLMAANQAAFSYGNNVAPQFFSYYLIRLGGNAFHLGLMQAFQYLFTNGLQLPTAYLSDRSGKRIPFIIAGIGISALIFLLITRFQDLWLIILFISIQSAALSIYFPSWSALLGDELSCANRGTVLAEITEASIAAGLMGSVSSFLFLALTPNKEANSFAVPFIAGAVSFFIAALLIAFIKESPAKKVTRVLKFKDADEKFLYLTKIQVSYNFFMSLSWPLYPLTVAKVLGATNVEIAVITMISIIVTAAFQPIAGKLEDKFGSVPLIQVTRYVFIAVPFVYAFAPSIFFIYIECILEGIMGAFVNVSFISYILDSSPPETRAEYFAYYNLGIGLATFAGTFLSGLAVVTLQAHTSWSLWQILVAIYLISGVGRFISAVPFAWMKAPTKYPSPPGQMAHAKMEFVRFLRRRH
jgi:MFS family permease